MTSFHIDYRTWGPKREDRPSILYEFDPPEKPAKRARPGFMMHDGMVVLNHQNNPVLNWNIPTTLSSITPGALMEAWRRKFGLEQEDSKLAPPSTTSLVLRSASESPYGQIPLQSGKRPYYP